MIFSTCLPLSGYRYRYADPDPETETCNRGLKQITIFCIKNEQTLIAILTGTRISIS